MATTRLKVSQQEIRAAQIADKYVRGLAFKCLFPSCGRKAIRSHSIPSSIIKLSLAVDEHVMSLSRSTTSILKNKYYDLGMLDKIPVSKAGTFKGYCNYHDNWVFGAAERDNKKTQGMYGAMHTRALSIECTRKLELLAFMEKKKQVLGYQDSADNLMVNLFKIEVKDLENRITRILSPHSSGIYDFRVFTVSKNIGVAACGVFSFPQNDSNHIICYNVIPYPDMSFLFLTAPYNDIGIVDTYISHMGGERYCQKIFNDIIFLRGEEALMSPSLWHRLSRKRKRETVECILSPIFGVQKIPPIVKVKRHEVGVDSNLIDRYLSKGI